MAVKNTSCGAENIFGGFNQTLFLGCSVMSFSGSVGWNEQQSEVTVLLATDPCASPEGTFKRYYNINLEASEWTDADPGFFGLDTNIIGAPVYFRVGNFEFSGLVQGWERANSTSGNPTYQVKIVDPRAIIENAKIIINEYAGGVGSLFNVINAFGFMESLGNSCPPYYQSAPGVYEEGDDSIDGAVFGSLAEAYGGANANHNGMQWNQILTAERLLWSAYPRITNNFSPYGRLVFKAPISYPASGMGIMPPNTSNLAYYYFDLQEVPNAPAYWRLNGVDVSALDAISQICQDSGHDYYIELIPVVGGPLGPGIHKFIKVRTANRYNAPLLNNIDTFVNAAGRQVISYNEGQELRNEITQSLVIGGPKNTFYQAEQDTDPEGDGQPTNPQADDMIVPYFGLHPNGDVITPQKDASTGAWFFDAYTDDLALQLSAPKYNRAISSTLKIDERELIAALSGFDQWLSYASLIETELWQSLSMSGMAGVLNLRQLIKILKRLEDLPNNKLTPKDFKTIRDAGLSALNTFDEEVAQIAHAWINKIATEYYGVKYQVRVPFTCGREDTESEIILSSDQPNDGGWTEVTPVLGLDHPSSYTDFFTLSDNRLGAFCRFDNLHGLEISNLNVNDFVTDSDIAWMKISVEEEYVYYDKSTLFSPRAVISLPQQIKMIQSNEDMPQIWYALTAIASNFGGGDGAIDKDKIKSIFEDTIELVTNMGLKFLMYNRAQMPDACGFGIKSNVLMYGPWGASGTVGGVDVRHDEGLVPWEYGGYSTLNAAGNATASAGVTNQYVSEQGQVTIAGYPELPLGAELLAADSGGPFNGGTGPNLVENRNTSSTTVSGLTYYYAPIGAWSGTYGPNVTGVTVQVGPDGMQTTYTLRTWTPKFGRFSRDNAQRIKRLGIQKLNYNKQIRAFTRQRLRQAALAHLDSLAGKKPGITMKEGVWNLPHTPHEVLVGQIVNWNNGNYDRPVVATESINDLQQELISQYDSKAFMSLDGLIRPVSMDGSGGLPRYASTLSACQKTTDIGAQSPIDKENEAGQFNQYNRQIDIDYLNPFSNPSSLNRSQVVSERSDTDSGHDIDIIGRGTSVPASSMIMPIEGYVSDNDFADSDHQDDYRMLALRGPLLIHGWGYDLDGFPVPNKADTESQAETGHFTNEGLKDKFMDNWLRKSKTWPVGPVDLRWDRQRSVWTVPQYRFVVGKLEQDICPSGSGLATRTSGPALYDNEGNEITKPQFIAKDYVGHECMMSGDNIIAKFDPYACEYVILEHKGSQKKEDMFRFYLKECVCINFAQRAERYAKAMRLKWNETSKQWQDDYEVKLYAGCGDQIGPASSGACGWAKVIAGASTTQSGVCNTGNPNRAQVCAGTGQQYQSYLSPTGSGGAQVIWLEEMANFIEFQTTDNVSCDMNSLCFTQAVRDRSAKANATYYWNGRQPQGDIVVRWSNAEDIESLPGYGNCDPEDELFIYKGVAVLDKEESSRAICSGSASCYNSGTCGKWVYNIVEWNRGNGLITDICCTGNINEDRPSISYSHIQLGTGLTYNRIETEDSTPEEPEYIDGLIRIESNIRTIDTNCAYTPESGYARTTGVPINFEQIHFGAGLWLYDPSAGENCTVPINGPCDNTDCLVHVFAGFRPLNNNQFCFTTGNLTTDGSRFINVVDFQGGLQAINGVGPTDIKIRSGVSASGSPDKCLYDTTQQPFATGLNHKIEFCRGLIVRDENRNDCKIEVAAGLDVLSGNFCLSSDGLGYRSPRGNLDGNNLISRLVLGQGLWGKYNDDDKCTLVMQAGLHLGTNNICVTGTPSDTILASTLKAGKGIYIQNDGCEATIGAGIHLKGTASCINARSDVENINEIRVGEGLGFDRLSNCVARLGLRMNIGGFYGSKISLGDCLEATDEGDCNIKIDLKDTCYPSGGGSGVCIKTSDTCLTTTTSGYGSNNPNGHLDTTCFNILNLGKGLWVHPANDNEAILQAGFSAARSTDCISNNPTSFNTASLLNKIISGKGVSLETDGVDGCILKIGAGLSATNSDACVIDEQDTSTYLMSNLIVGKGLKFKNEGCDGFLGLDLKVNLYQTAKIILEDGFFHINSSACETTLEVADLYGVTPSNTTSIFYVVSDVTATPCPSCGIQTLTVTKSAITVNKFGQVISVQSQPDTVTNFTCCQ